MSDWDASRYHRISEPQFDWGQQVIRRLQPRPGERILDIGCGTGRLTTAILDMVHGAHVVGLDRSRAMLTVARAAADGQQLPHRSVVYVQGDAAALPFSSVFDAVFSAATLHWIHDHDALTESVFGVLKPGGRFVAQCGGARNLDRLLQRATDIMRTSRYERYFHAWQDPWYFADHHVTAARLHAAGFVEVETSLEDAPVSFNDAAAFGEFISVVCIRHHLERLPLELRVAFTGELTEQFREDVPAFVLDYQRLNLAARKPQP